jgi:hypothetical protein
VQHSIDREPRIRQNPQFADQSGLGNLDHRVNHSDVLRDEGGSSPRLIDRGARCDGGLMAMQHVIQDSYQWMTQ